jgi:hypothetical protein
VQLGFLQSPSRGKRLRAATPLLTAIVAACLLAPSAQGGQEQQSFMVRASSHSIVVGGYQIWAGLSPGVDPTYGAAITAFGPATTCRLTGIESGSKATWPTIGVVATFATLEGLPPGSDACTATNIHLSRLALRDKRWRTSLGLHVGDRVTKLRRLYPRALAHGTSLWIVPANSAAFGPRALFGATIRNERITSFFFDIRAQGE